MRVTGAIQTQLTAAFSNGLTADAAVQTLAAAGIPLSSIDLQHGVLSEARQREGRFLWRVLVAIVLWSIAGGVIGAGFGWLLAEIIGPEGTAGLMVQLVSWVIVGHLVGGMLAGYFLLADRTQREMPPDRPVSLLTVRDLGPRDRRRVEVLLRPHHPLELRFSRRDEP